MSAVPNPQITPQEYLARERISESRHQFYRGEIFAMAEATEAHNIITDNVTFALYVFQEFAARRITAIRITGEIA